MTAAAARPTAIIACASELSRDRSRHCEQQRSSDASICQSVPCPSSERGHLRHHFYPSGYQQVYKRIVFVVNSSQVK